MTRTSTPSNSSTPVTVLVMLVVIGSSLRPGVSISSVQVSPTVTSSSGSGGPTNLPGSSPGAGLAPPPNAPRPPSIPPKGSSLSPPSWMILPCSSTTTVTSIGSIAAKSGMSLESTGSPSAFPVTLTSANSPVMWTSWVPGSGPSEMAWMNAAVPAMSSEASPGTSSPASMAASPEAVISMCCSRPTSYWNSSPEVKE